MSLGLRPPKFEVLGVGAGAGAWPKGDVDGAGVAPKALPEKGVAGAGAAPPNAEPPVEPPKGLGAGAEAAPVPKAVPGLEPKGELAGAGAVGVVPKGDLFSPPNDDWFELGAVVADDVVETDAPPETPKVELKGDLLSPPPKGDFDAPKDAVMLPKPNDVPPCGGWGGAGAGA
mmetsp:Transcript_34246/g.72118  ORF Transcript_34246/g.72118 Transcript_34246/m.72118 type:complete len:173 (-) Transcript_34246:2374-2892(-)